MKERKIEFETMNHNERMNYFINKKKKNNLITIIQRSIFGIIVCLLFGVGLYGVGYYEHHYQKDALVIYTNKDEIACVTIDCNEWSFVGNDFNVGDEIVVTFFDNYTLDNIYDDEIIFTKKK